MANLFFSVDWGTSQFRLRAVRAADLQIVAEHRSDAGVARLAQGDSAERAERYRHSLALSISELAVRLGPAAEQAPCAISGMASSSVGWRELEYSSVPLSLDGGQLRVEPLEPLESSRGPHRTLLISGLRTASDVMRGEETQLLGLFQLPIASGLAEGALVILPGTHSKHVYVHRGQIVGFETFMTGELFEVLIQHSLLRHSVEISTIEKQVPSAAFSEGVAEARTRRLSAALFRVRTRQVLDQLPPVDNREYLSGLLIGSELAELLEPRHADLPILLAAPAALAARYVAAMEVLSLTDRLVVVEPADVDRMASAGHALVLARHLPD